MTLSLRQAATYIERDGAHRVLDVDAGRDGFNRFEGSAGAFGGYSFLIHDEDIPELDRLRDLAYSALKGATR